MKWQWKQIVVASIVGLLLGGAVGRWSVYGSHHRKGSFEKRFEKKIERFSRKLSLNADQKEKVRVIFAQKREKIKAFHEESRARYQVLRKETIDQVKPLLTDDQKKTFDGLEKKRAERFSQRRKKYGFRYPH